VLQADAVERPDGGVALPSRKLRRDHPRVIGRARRAVAVPLGQVGPRSGRLVTRLLR